MGFFATVRFFHQTCLFPIFIEIAFFPTNALHSASNQSDATVRDLARALHSPFRPHVARYAQYESALLRQELAPYCAASASKDLIDELRACAVSVAKVAAVVEGASKRCCDVTEGEEMEKE